MGRNKKAPFMLDEEGFRSQIGLYAGPHAGPCRAEGARANADRMIILKIGKVKLGKCGRASGS